VIADVVGLGKTAMLIGLIRSGKPSQQESCVRLLVVGV
jgi:hypothetical protein